MYENNFQVIIPSAMDVNVGHVNGLLRGYHIVYITWVVGLSLDFTFCVYKMNSKRFKEQKGKAPNAETAFVRDLDLLGLFYHTVVPCR